MEHRPLRTALTQLENLNPRLTVGLQPGLNDHEINVLTKGFPCPLSPEMHTLYRWRNGYAQGVTWRRQIFREGMFLPLEWVMEQYRETEQFAREEYAVEMGGEQPEPDLRDPLFFSSGLLGFWYPNWFPVLVESGSYLLFTVLCKDVIQPALYSRNVSSAFPIMKFDSVTALIQSTTEAFATGAYWIDSEGDVQSDQVKAAQVIDRHNPLRRHWLYRLAGDAHSIEDIVDQVAGNDSNKLERALIALGQLLDSTAAPKLRTLLSHRNRTVRWHVVELLGEMRDANSLNALLPLLEDPDQSVQDRVIMTLWSIGDLQAIAPLEAKLARTQSEKLRQTLTTGLRILREGKAG